MVQLGELEQLVELGELEQLGELVTHPEIAQRTELLVLQGSPFCNVDCEYCYLPNRSDRRRMPLETISASVHWLIANGLAGDGFTIVWHAGEPLALPQNWYEQAFECVAETAPNLAIRHAIQTNATLINADWAAFLRERGVSVGVSLDGPAVIHDARRRTRAGGGTHTAAMEGISHLRAADVPFHVIAVVGAATLADPENFIAFFDDLDPRELGLNFEETEGANALSSLADAGVGALRSFLTLLLDHVAIHGRPRLREARQLIELLRSDDFGPSLRTQENVAFRILTVDINGGLHTFSPELAGAPVAGWDGLPLGHVGRDNLPAIVASPRFRRVAAAVERGVITCRTNCPYFSLCGGGAPANKVAETGRFDTTETRHCRATVQLVSEVFLRRLEHDLKQTVPMQTGLTS